MKIVFEHPSTGEIKVAPVGFSWSTLLFGALIPLYRGDYKWAILMFIIDCLTLIVIGHFIFAVIYNEIFIKDLVRKGFRVRDVIDGNLKDAEMKLKIRLKKIEEVK